MKVISILLCIFWQEDKCKPIPLEETLFFVCLNLPSKFRGHTVKSKHLWWWCGFHVLLSQIFKPCLIPHSDSFVLVFYKDTRTLSTVQISSYSSHRHSDSLVKNRHNSPGEKSAMALRQLYSAESTCSLFSLSTWSWKTLTWSMKDTTRSADIGDEWNPAAASRGAMCRGNADWAAFRMNSSLQLSLSSATCRNE